MKTQKHNEGELAELKVNVEVQLIKDLETMSANSDFDIDEIVAIAVKRFRSSHADYMGVKVDFP
ncbi:MAG: hypothetical protein ACJAS4_002584 [Bacteriovoracaceae bacterium]|jgi:uncharacterized protein (DUF736 family)